MLIVSFEIHRSGPRELRARFQNGDVRAPGVEPHIEDVGLFSKCLASTCAGKSWHQEITDRMLEPSVGAFAAEDLDDAIEKLGRGDRLCAFLAIQNRDRYAPQPLARDAPEIGRAHGLNSSHVAISYAVFCLKKKRTVYERFCGCRRTAASRYADGRSCAPTQSTRCQRHWPD